MAGPEETDAQDAIHCRDLVRKEDKDRFLASLFAPEAKRQHLMALYAFDVEVTRIRHQVREPALGEIRLQWWAEAVEALYGGTSSDHPVVRALGRAIEAGGLPKQAFLDLIDARRFDLYDDPMSTMRTFEGYAGETTSALIQMAAVILIGSDASRVVNVAGHGGVAQAVVRALRLARADRVRGKVVLPEEFLLENGLKASDYLAGRWSDSMNLAFARMRHAARNHLKKARSYDPDVPLEALPAFLPLVLVDLYLKRMERTGFNAFTMSAEVSQLRRQWVLLRASWYKTY